MKKAVWGTCFRVLLLWGCTPEPELVDVTWRLQAFQDGQEETLVLERTTSTVFFSTAGRALLFTAERQDVL